LTVDGRHTRACYNPTSGRIYQLSFFHGEGLSPVSRASRTGVPEELPTMSKSACDELADDDVAPAARLEEIVTTEELAGRPSRPPQHEAENRFLVSLATALADRPDTLFQKLAEAALELTGAGSAGISVLEPDGGQFRWRATAGVYQRFLGATLPRAFSPAGRSSTGTPPS
jgi:hypothetical protein